MKKISLYLKPETLKQWKHRLLDDGLNQTEWFRSQVKEYLAKTKKKGDS